MDIKNEIKMFAKSIGVDVIGFTGVESLNAIKKILEKRKEKGQVTSFENKDIEKRINPLKLLPEAKSIIVLGLSYYYDEIKNDKSEFVGKVARYSWVKDYHVVLREKMNLIMDFIEEKLTYRPKHLLLVDTSPLVERQLALQAGIGFLGQNAFIINEDCGSYIVLGEILIDLELEKDPLKESDCLKCKKCLKACPTGALKEPYTINPNMCVSFWTQTKRDIPRNIRPFMKNQIVGCDICQEVCPHNQKIKKASQDNFKLFPDLINPDLLEILQISNSEFKRRFGDTAASWCGRRVLQRNALVALGNSGDRNAVSHIVPFLEDERPQIRLHAAWALGKLGGIDAQNALQKQLVKEKDNSVREEILHSLKSIKAQHKNHSKKPE